MADEITYLEGRRSLPQPWPQAGPQRVGEVGRFWRWRAIFNGRRDGSRRIGPEITGSNLDAASAPIATNEQDFYANTDPLCSFPPFISRVLKIAAEKAEEEGQDFIKQNEIYKRKIIVTTEINTECTRRIEKLESELSDLRSSSPSPLFDAGTERQRGAQSASLLHTSNSDGFEIIPREDLVLVFSERAGNRAEREAHRANLQQKNAHEQLVAVKADALAGQWENLHQSKKTQARAVVAQREWYQYSITRYEDIVSWAQALMALYWTSNARVRRSLWRRIAQFFFRRWVKRPFVSDPIKIFPRLEKPHWVKDYDAEKNNLSGLRG